MIPPGRSFPSRGCHLEVMSWVGHTIFGTMSGKPLNVPGTRLRRSRAKTTFSPAILGHWHRATNLTRDAACGLRIAPHHRGSAHGQKNLKISVKFS